MFGTLVIMREHGADHIRVTMWLEDIEQRVQGAMSVPQREGRVVDESVRLMDHLVNSFIGAVNVHIDRRVDKSMVDRGIEIHFLVFCSLDLYLVQLCVPGCLT